MIPGDEKPFLRPARNAQEAAVRASFIARAMRQLAEIEQYFLDVAHWNDLHPHETIDPDPDGTMACCVAYLKQFREGR